MTKRKVKITRIEEKISKNNKPYLLVHDGTGIIGSMWMARPEGFEPGSEWELELETQNNFTNIVGAQEVVNNDSGAFASAPPIVTTERVNGNDEDKLKFLRGMCFNNAATLIGGRGDQVIDPAEVFVLAKKLYDKAREVDFVNWQ